MEDPALEAAQAAARTLREVPGRPLWQRAVGRRTLLLAGGGALLVAALPAGEAMHAMLADDATPSLTLDLLRREDMLKLQFEFFNLKVSTAAGPPKLVPDDPSAQCVVVVKFDSQHLMEETTFTSGHGTNPPQPPAQDLPAPGDLALRAVGPSRIVFLVPSTVKELPYTEEGLLAWSEWVMRVLPGAAPASDPQQIGALQTDLLLVDWLHMTPEQYASWAHVTHPVTSSGRTELWHTRLAPRDRFGRPDPLLGAADIRATAFDAPDLHNVVDIKFNTLLGYPNSNPDALKGLVTQSNENGAVHGDLVLLSALGSSLELEGKWDDESLEVAEYRHRSAIGRDNYVRVEERGFLFPYGHRAVLVVETERVIASDGAAHLVRRAYIRVREPVKAFADNGLPFRSVEIMMTTTPNLAQQPDSIPPAPAGTLPSPDASSFWVQYLPDGATLPVDVPFPVTATDWEGNAIELTAFLAFVHLNDANKDTVLAELQSQFSPDAFTADALTPRRTHELGGQKVAFAPTTGTNDPKQGVIEADIEDDVARSTTFPTVRMHLNMKKREVTVSGEAGFSPQMLAAEIRMPAVEALTGSALPVAMGYEPDYVTNSFGVLKAEMFARVQSSVPEIGALVQAIKQKVVPLPNGETVSAVFGGVVDQVGGIAAPDLDIRGLSRTLGPLSGFSDTITDIATKGTFKPQDFFAPTAKLLGGLSLGDLLGPLADDGTVRTLPFDSGPKIVSTPQYPGGDKTQPPNAVVTTFDWTPQLPDKLTAGVFLPELDEHTPASLTLHGESRTVFGPQPVTTSSIKGDLRDFALILVNGDEEALGFIKLTFQRFAFESHNGSKPTMHVELGKVEFIGPLNFVNTLQRFLASTGKGLGIDVQPAGITASYTLAIPDVGVGVFVLQHLAFSASLNIPFDGGPARARFAFCSREHPFTLTVSFFGGGGFLALALGTDGFEMLEASIEFGGAAAFNLGVASGSVSIMAGIYFKLEHKPTIPASGSQPEIASHDDVTLTGYVRANGQLNVLGLITISAEFYLALSYVSDNHQNLVEGEASLTVEIDILFFSKSVMLSVHKSFAGPGGSSSLSAAKTAAALPAAGAGTPPMFGDQMSQDDWNTYCDAFAA